LKFQSYKHLKADSPAFGRRNIYSSNIRYWFMGAKPFRKFAVQVGSKTVQGSKFKAQSIAPGA
jgi:hypothetical protein